MPAYTTRTKHLRNQLEQWSSLCTTRVETTNRKAVQSIRPATVNRKVGGGNRTEAGTVMQGLLMSEIVSVTVRPNFQ